MQHMDDGEFAKVVSGLSDRLGRTVPIHLLLHFEHPHSLKGTWWDRILCIRWCVPRTFRVESGLLLRRCRSLDTLFVP